MIYCFGNTTLLKSNNQSWSTHSSVALLTLLASTANILWSIHLHIFHLFITSLPRTRTRNIWWWTRQLSNERMKHRSQNAITAHLPHVIVILADKSVPISVDRQWISLIGGRAWVDAITDSRKREHCNCWKSDTCWTERQWISRGMLHFPAFGSQPHRRSTNR